MNLKYAAILAIASMLLAACAVPGIQDLGTAKNRDGTVTDYRAVTAAPKNAPVQVRIESRDYKADGATYQQVGTTTVPATGGNDLGHDMAVAGMNIPAAVAGGLALGKTMPGTNVQGSTAKAAAGQSQATSGTAGTVTINQ